MTKDNIQELLRLLEFEQDGNVFSKRYENINEPLKVDIGGDGHIYYRECGISIGRETTCNLLEPENLVVLHCVDRLLWKGYSPFHIELEPAWKLGHSAKGGYADVWVRTYKNGGFDGSDDDKESLLIIECKTWGREFDGAWADTKEDGAQLFSYFQQERATQFLCLYTADIIEGKIEQDYHLINVQDNEEKLANEESAKSYKDATNNKQLYNVWHETYHDDYATRGLFEEEIEPYRIGKNKYTTKDLKSVDNDTIQKKYNEFALILRQHNVGGYENAFDKLVNLFLAKVVDETSNPDDLNFYWKGSAYDDDYRLQDRLQRLYRDGMKRFLNEDVTYIEDGEIEKAFRRFKNDPDATKKTIKSYFRALKFFSDNDFSFISVHNKKLFEQNAAILLKVVKMLQDIKLKDSDQNQLLGDLFEGFLNKGVKQSEGQFFTPMPIVRFLVSSLPLEKIIQNSEEIPSAIDYACGAGHFLTEYAVQIKDYIEKYRPSIPLNEYYARITGIEKEYRLSKVSKVSAFMYGHDDTKIIYSDALVPTEDVREGAYDVLIANPPYSVKGFLETLTESQRKHYSLFNDGLNIAKNNAIEIFFIERAAQLLKAGGVAGIILPVSVLNKDGIYAKAREIILQKFDIVGLVEFGSGTFGKTGTNTVTMFLRRKETNTPDAEHYQYRVDCWFCNYEKCESNDIYDDTDLLQAYCDHCDYNWEDYLAFLSGNMTESFMEQDTIQAYKAAFFGNQRNAMKGVCDQAKDIRAKFMSRQNTQAYRRLSDDEKRKQEAKAFLQFVIAIEKEKVYYYILAKTTSNPVVIVKSPSGTTNIKRFLGYEWSDSKGNEGIKYLNVATQSSSDDEGNGEDDDTLHQIEGIKGIQTPLFNPKDLSDISKINSIIRANYLGEEISIPDDLAETVTMGNLYDLMEFKQTAFDKTIKMKASLKMTVESKYEIIPLKNYCTAINPSKEEFRDIDPQTHVSFIEMSSLGFGRINSMEDKTLHELSSGGYTNFRENDVLIAKITPCMENGKCCLAEGLINGLGLGSTEYHVFRTSSRNRAKYLFEYLNREEVRRIAATNMTGASGHRRVPEFFYVQMPIPNVPNNVIDELAGEFDTVDIVFNDASSRIITIEKKMEALLQNSQINAHTSINFSRADLFDISIGRRVLKSEIVKDGVYDVYSANVFEPFGKTIHSVLSDFSKPSVLWGIDGDWMVNYQEAEKPFNPTDHCGVIRVLDETVVNPKYLVWPLLKAGETERFSRSNRASTERVKSLSIMLPDIETQNEVAQQLIDMETEIATLKSKMQDCITKKQEILDKYLK